MRMSQAFVQTLREAPGEARTPGYRWLLRAGYLWPLATGATGGAPRGLAFLPLATRLRERVERALWAALGDNSAQPVALPSLQDAGPAGEPGAPRPALRTGHESLVMALAAGTIRSYRQLPLWLAETWQAHFDAESDAVGLLGRREGRVLDRYGLYGDTASMAAGYAQALAALATLARGWDLALLPVVSAEAAEAVAAGHRLVLPWPGGGESFAHCSRCGYAAAQAIARVSQAAPPDEPAQPRQDVETPGCKTIAELAHFLQVPEARTAKAVFLVSYSAAQGDRFVFAIVRGDTALNEDKLKAVLGVEAVGPATEAEIRQAGAEPGYGSPVGLQGVTVVVDHLVAQSPNLVMGANRPGFHTLNVNYGRDYQAVAVADIASAQAGSPCPQCGSPLAPQQGVTLAELLQVGAAVGEAANATYLDAAGQARPLLLATVRIHVDRIVAALAERHQDANGLLWPADLAPYQVYLMTLGKTSAELGAAATRLYDDLRAAGISVLFDDRDERAGVKFNDADLLGLPLRVAVGDRSLQNGAAEVKPRGQPESETVALGQLPAHIAARLSGA